MTKRTIALVAHDGMKHDMVEWVHYNIKQLAPFRLVCTGTTGKLIQQLLSEERTNLPGKDFEVVRLKSGPLGGDQQLGAMISEGKIDSLIFFWDPMQPQAHDVDVKALLRIAVLYNLPTASNRSSADHLISSPLFLSDYKPDVKDYGDYISREV
jgi:methylglyoxal synthase